MFESMTDRIAGTVLMGLDVAVEFATLGEFRLVEADASPASDNFQPAPLVRRPVRLDAVATDTRLLPPASTAIARAAAESAARVASRRGTPRLDELFAPKQGAKAVIPSAPRRRPASGQAIDRQTQHAKATPRKRAGAVESGTQLCLFSGRQ